MHTLAELSGSHLKTYNSIIQHPVAHNLEWRKVYSLLQHIGVLTVEHNDHLKASRNGHELILHRSRSKDVSEAAEVMQLRHFLQRSNAPARALAAGQAQWLLLIDHQKARIFRCDVENPAAEVIHPHAPSEFFRHLHDSKDFSRGKEKPDANSYFGPIGNALKPPGQILIFGHGTGTSSEMDEFLAWARERRPILASQIVGATVVDTQHMTDGEIVAQARAMLAAASPADARAPRA
jgi:hypothetical protein